MVGDWQAVTAQRPGQQPVTIEHHMRRVLSGKALSFTTTFNGVENYQGLFAYDAARKLVAFWYPSADGDLTSGTVSQQKDYTLLDFTVVNGDGTTAPYQVHIAPTGANDYD